MSLTTSEILERAAALIEPEGAWTPGVLARDASGIAVDYDDPAARCWCAIGAIYCAAPDKNAALKARAELRHVWQARTAYTWAGDWNDSVGQAEVVQALRDAAAAARDASGGRCESTVCLRAAVTWQKKHNADLERQLAVHWEPTIDYGCRLGRVIYGVPVAHCKRVIKCESTNNRWLINSPGSDTARGYAQFLPSTWAGTAFGRAGFSIFDALAPILQMDAIAKSQGFDTSYGWAASYPCHHLSGAEG